MSVLLNKVLFGDDENYFETFDMWFNNSLL